MKRTSEEVQEREHEDGIGEIERIDEDRLSTGIIKLDQELRGFPQGSTIAILGGTSMANVMNIYLALTLRKTHYVTTTRDSESIKEQLEVVPEGSDKFNETTEITEINDLSEGNLPNALGKMAGRMDEYENLVIDSFGPAEKISEAEYYRLLRKIQRKTKQAKGITYLYYPVNPEDLTRQEKEGLNIVDGVITVDEHIDQTNEVIFRIRFQKLRGEYEIPSQALAINVGNRFGIDPSQGLE